MVELAVFTGLFAGCVVGVRGLLTILAILVLSLPSLGVASGWDAVFAGITAIVALQVGYAAAALMPVCLHKPAPEPAPIRAG